MKVIIRGYLNRGYGDLLRKYNVMQDIVPSHYDVYWLGFNVTGKCEIDGSEIFIRE